MTTTPPHPSDSMADTIPPPSAPLSAEAKAFRFWLCRLPWVVFGIFVAVAVVAGINNDSLSQVRGWQNGLEAVALIMLFMPLVGYIRLSWRVLTKLSTLSTSQMRLIAWTSSVRVVWLSWPQWIITLTFLILIDSYGANEDDKIEYIIKFILGLFMVVIPAFTLVVTSAFTLGWELELLIRRLFRRKG